MCVHTRTGFNTSVDMLCTEIAFVFYTLAHMYIHTCIVGRLFGLITITVFVELARECLHLMKSLKGTCQKLLNRNSAIRVHNENKLKSFNA